MPSQNSTPLGSHPPTSQPKPLRLEDLSVPVPHAEHVRGFQDLYHRLYGTALEPEEAACLLYRVLVVIRYRQLARPQGNSPRSAPPERTI